MQYIRGRRFGWLGLTLLVAAACDVPDGNRDETELGAPGTAQAGPVDTIQAQRDSLFTEVAQTARLLNQIGDELSKIEGLSEPDSGTVESAASAGRERVLHKVRQVTARLADSEKRLAQQRRSLRRAGQRGDSLTGRVGELETMLADFEAMLESQRTTLTTLTDRVTALESENLALRDTITTMEGEENTAYYVVGTKEELLERGIVTKEGGSRVLFIFGKRGETLVPARDLDTSQFTPIDIRQVTEIPLPDSTAEYLIASRQNLDALATANGDGANGDPQAAYPQYQADTTRQYMADTAWQHMADTARTGMADTAQKVAVPDEDNGNGDHQNGDAEKSEAEKRLEKGKVRGTIRIDDPREFWLPSKFLIIVRT